MTEKIFPEKNLPEKIMQQVIRDQQNEIDAYTIYSRTARIIRNQHNADILRKIAQEELNHYQQLKRITGKALKPGIRKVFFFMLITRIFGLTFGLKLLEKGEEKAVQIDYKGLEKYIPGLSAIIEHGGGARSSIAGDD